MCRSCEPSLESRHIMVMLVACGNAFVVGSDLCSIHHVLAMWLLWGELLWWVLLWWYCFVVVLLWWALLCADMTDKTVAHMLGIIFPKLEAQLMLAKNVQLIEALQEVKIHEEDASFLSPQCQFILGIHTCSLFLMES